MSELTDWKTHRGQTHLDGHPRAVETLREENVLPQQAVVSDSKLQLKDLWEDTAFSRQGVVGP